MSEKKVTFEEIKRIIREGCIMCDNGVAGSRPVLLAIHEVSGHSGEEWGEEAIECQYCGTIVRRIKLLFEENSP